VDFSKSLILLATVGAACANWFVVRGMTGRREH